MEDGRKEAGDRIIESCTERVCAKSLCLPRLSRWQPFGPLHSPPRGPPGLAHLVRGCACVCATDIAESGAQTRSPGRGKRRRWRKRHLGGACSRRGTHLHLPASSLACGPRPRPRPPPRPRPLIGRRSKGGGAEAGARALISDAAPLLRSVVPEPGQRAAGLLRASLPGATPLFAAWPKREAASPWEAMGALICSGGAARGAPRL